MTTAGERALATLRRKRPAFHGIDLGTPGNIQIGDDVLAWLAVEVPGGGTTLETGSGYSTVVFSASSKRHVAIAPAGSEFVAIRSFCAASDIDVSALDPQVGISQRVLPALDLPAFDVVLIDGDHAFPAPFLDYYYVADHVKDGGRLLVDDCHLRTGHLLRDFLIEEPGWALDTDLGKTAVFRRDGTVPPSSRWWGEQPWSQTFYAVHGDGARRRVDSLRTQLRLRTKIRRWL